MSWVTPPSPASGSGSSATAAAQYLVLAVDATLTGERDFTPSSGLTATDGGAGGDYSLAMTSRVIDQSGVSLVSQLTTTFTIVSFLIQPNTLGTDRTVRCVTIGTFDNLRAAQTISGSLQIFLGGTIVYEDAFFVPSQTTPVRAPFFYKYEISAENATNAQVVSGYMLTALASLGATTGLGNLATDEVSHSTPFLGTAAVDSTTTLTFMAILINVAPVASMTGRSFYHVASVL